MLNLIIKDVVLQKKTMLVGFVYIFVMILAFNNAGTAMLTASAFAVAFLLIQTPCAYDDKNRAEAMLNSLPLKRGTIVAAKYLSVALYVLIAVAEYLAIYWIITLLGLPFRVTPLSLETAAGLLVTVALFSSIFYPIFFRFGYMKTRYVNVFLFAGLFGAGSALMAALGDEGWQAAKGFADAVNSQPDWLVALGLLGVMLGIMLVSYLMSLRFYSKREF